MKKILPWIAVLGVLAIIVLWFAGVYNRFVSADEQVESANRAAVAHVSETVSDALTEEAVREPDAAPAMPDPAEPITLTLESDK